MAKENYTAILYVHGIGQRTNHEDIGSLLDALEDFPTPLELNTAGELRDFGEGVEPENSEDSQEPDVPYTFFKRIEFAQAKHRFRGNFRAYEVYWSSITGRGQSPWTMVFWLIKQAFVPIRYYFSGWRLAFRLKIARLHYLNQQAEFSESGIIRVLSHFKQFLGPVGRRTSPEDNHTAFKRYLTSNTRDAVGRAITSALADRWHQSRTPAEITSGKLIRHSIGIWAATSLWVIESAIAASSEVGHWNNSYQKAMPITVKVEHAARFMGLPLAIAAAIFLLWFLGRTASDIRLWASIRENEKNYRLRRAIIDKAKRAITHVIKDAHCTRIIIVAHSLGTSIAFDALRELGKHNIARLETRPKEVLQLSKLSHFITLGSPIDKVSYFFESKDSQHYRANRVRETMRGDLSREPFFRNGKQQISWINIWDDADIISDALYCPLSQKHDGSRFLGATIENIQIASGIFPNPYKTHTRYLENRTAVALIFGAIFLNDHWRFSEASSVPPALQNCANRIIRKLTRVAFSTGIWSFGVAAVALLLRNDFTLWLSLTAFASSVATIGFCFVIAKFRQLA